MTDKMGDFMGEVAANGGNQEVTAETEKYIFDNAAELIQAINEKCQLISLPEGTRFVFRNDKDEPRIIGRRDAELELAQYQLEVEIEKKGETSFKLLPGFGVWLRSEKRRQFAGKVFKPGEEVGGRYLNEWSGFAVQPQPGDWSLLRAHIHDNICNGNAEHFAYLMGWMAQLFQEPGRKIGVAVVLRGAKGVGKSTLGDWIRAIIGPRHVLVASNKDQWTGRFTSQLELVIFLSCEEALFAGSHEQDSSIKHLISSEDFSYEAKGKQISGGKNYTRVLVTSNENWVVPTTPDERRFFVLDVGKAHREDTDYFEAINEQMRNGGAGAMLYDLLEFDYCGINLRKPPVTDALLNQIEVGLAPDLAWLTSVLSEGGFTYLSGMRPMVEWPDRIEDGGGDERFILKSDIQDSYREFVPGRRDRPVTDSAIGKFLAKHVPGIEGVKRRVHGQLTPFYRLPPLSEARAAFEKANPRLRLAPMDREEETKKPKLPVNVVTMRAR